MGTVKHSYQDKMLYNQSKLAVKSEVSSKDSMGKKEG